jgi:hypothetical protein
MPATTIRRMTSPEMTIQRFDEYHIFVIRDIVPHSRLMVIKKYRPSDALQRRKAWRQRSLRPMR